MNSDSKTLTLIPIGRLADRLRVIASAIALAVRIETPLEVIWFTNEELYCPSSRLFTVNPLLIEQGIRIREAKLSDWFFNDRPHKGNAYFTYPFLFFKYDRYLSPTTISKLLMTNEENVWSFFSGKERVLIASSVAFGNFPDMFSVIEPTAEVLNAYRSMTTNWEENIVGVHLHYEEQASYRQNSTELFIKKMQSLVENDPSVRFFISSEIVDERERLATIFSDRIYMPYTLSGSNSPDECINAFGELLALAQTKQILSTKNSSFSYVASLIGGIPYEPLSIYTQPY